MPGADGLDVRIAVLTVRRTGDLEPILFATRAFESHPSYRNVLGEPPSWLENLQAGCGRIWCALGKLFGRQRKADRSVDGGPDSPPWAQRGILVCVSLDPRLVQVRLGEDLRYAVPQQELWDAIEGRVCELALQKRTREATVAAVQVVLERLDSSGRRDRRPRWWWRQVGRRIAELTSFSYPDWRPYHFALFRPVLNGLALALKLTGREAWGLVVWLVVLYLPPPLAYAPFRGTPNALKASRAGCVARLWLLWLLVRIALFVPTYAALNLLVVPYWGNVVAVRSHLYPAIGRAVNAHDLFALRSGFLRGLTTNGQRPADRIACATERGGVPPPHPGRSEGEC